jgi:hypothetical protein
LIEASDSPDPCCSYFRDSRHSINASPDAIKKPGALIHIGKIIPLMTTSHPKNSRRRCITAISENTIIAMVVNGIMIPSFLERLSLSPIYYQWNYSQLYQVPTGRTTGKTLASQLHLRSERITLCPKLIISVEIFLDVINPNGNGSYTILFLSDDQKHLD